jgi:hypothetical protein
MRRLEAGSGTRETPPPCASGVENPVPEAGADPEIGVVVIVMRHMAHPRLVEPVAWLDREMMGRVMDEHVGGVTQQHPAGERAGGDVVQDSYREIAGDDDEATRYERRHADEFIRCL